MGFWSTLASFGSAPAVIDGETGESLSYSMIADRIERAAAVEFNREKKLVFFGARNDLSSIVCYLCLLRSGHLIYLFNGQKPHVNFSDMIARYAPDLIVWGDAYAPGQEGYSAPRGFLGCLLSEKHDRTPLSPLFPGSALLLATSGSTSTPKLARLSFRNLAVSATQTAASLHISAADKAITSLPFHHAYGLSVLHSNLASGGSVVVTRKPVLSKAFWKIILEHKVTSLAAVPTTLAFMKEAFERRDVMPFVEKMTNASGAMGPDLQKWVLQQVVSRGTKFYSMYGMTEAAGRISVLDPALFQAGATGSVGAPVAGGQLRILEDGEVEYRGPNIMMGYAETREDLGLGDIAGGVLRTGDLGRIDDAGLHITGRKSRICKIFEVRHSLDEIERYLSKAGEIAVVSCDNRLQIFFTSGAGEGLRKILPSMENAMNIPHHVVDLFEKDRLPRTDSGKIIYPLLKP